MVKVMIQQLTQQDTTTGDGSGITDLDKMPNVGDALDLKDGTKGTVTAVDSNTNDRFEFEENVDAVVTVQVGQ